MMEKFPNMNPYNYCFQNPVMFKDPTGMEPDEECGEELPNYKLTGSSNLLIYINEKRTKTNLQAMHKKSGKYDFICVDNIDEVPDIMKSAYGDNTPEIKNLVVRSHGICPSDGSTMARGAMLSNDANVSVGPDGIIGDPKNSPGLKYLRQQLSHDANVLFTACNMVTGYSDDPFHMMFHKGAREIAQNYSEFFCKGSDRKLFLNGGTSLCRLQVSNTEFFMFDRLILESNYAGFLQFYYNDGKWSKNNDYYDFTIPSSGGMNRQTIRNLSNPSNSPRNQIQPIKKL